MKRNDVGDNIQMKMKNANAQGSAPDIMVPTRGPPKPKQQKKTVSERETSVSSSNEWNI